jgi:hypothetical protein|uniref:Uncharacterized protein n=1 Tax=Fagus sylvatica TaxID=28930 RepID=A0A2N9EHK3_FAGSY
MNFGGTRRIIFLLLIIIAITTDAATPLDGDKSLKIVPLDRGPVPPSAPSRCTHMGNRKVSGGVGNCPSHG